MYKININGYISPIEKIDISMMEFENFSNQFKSSQRDSIFSNFKTVVKEIDKYCEEPITIWIKGSFVSAKMNPNDMDLTIFMSPKDKNELSELVEFIYTNSDNLKLDINIKAINLNCIDDEQQVQINAIENQHFNRRSYTGSIIENCSGYFNIII